MNNLNPNYIVSTAPAGTSDNRTASTAFVTGAVATAVATVSSSIVAVAATIGKTLLVPATTVSSVATVDIVLTGLTLANYSCIEIVLDNFVADTGAVGTGNLLFRMSTDGGATYASSAGAYKYASLRFQDAADVANVRDSAPTAVVLISSMSNSGNGAEGASGSIKVWRPSDANTCGRVTWEIISGFQGGLTDCFGATGFAKLTSNVDTDAVRILASAGNLRGIYCVYGWRQ